MAMMMKDIQPTHLLFDAPELFVSGRMGTEVRGYIPNTFLFKTRNCARSHSLFLICVCVHQPVTFIAFLYAKLHTVE